MLTSGGQKQNGQAGSMAFRESSRVLSLDGLRGVSIAIVVVSHSGLEHVIPGGFGVTLFFFISGYLITGQLVAEHDANGRISLGNFYLRRALRLMPASFAFIGLVTLLWWLLIGPVPMAELASGLFYYANYYYLLIQEPIDTPVRKAYQILWSLAVEEHFYLLWPCVLVCCLKAGRSALWVACAACVVIAVWRMRLLSICLSGGSQAMCGHGEIWERFYEGTDTRLDSILYGAVLALLLRYGMEAIVRPRMPVLITAGVMLLSTFVLRGEEFRDVWRFTVQGLALLILVPAMIMPVSVVRRFLEWPVLVWIGQLSYSLYLFHWAGYMLADGLTTRRGALWLGLAVVFSAVFTLLSYYGIERPMLAVRQRARRRSTRVMVMPSEAGLDASG